MRSIVFLLLFLCRVALSSAEPLWTPVLNAPLFAPAWYDDVTFFRWCDELTYAEIKREKVGNITIVKPHLNRVYYHRDKIGRELFERWYTTFVKCKMGNMTEQEMIDAKTEMRAVVDACDRNVI